MPEDSITLRVNGEARTLDAPGTLPLLWALRERLGLTGTKYGCGVGACGICIVHVDGEPMHACTTPLEAVRGRAVTTIEGLAREPGHPVVRAWIDAQVPQCGYCQPGQVMAAAALLARHPHPDEAQIARFLSPVLCRCGTQPRIRRALHAAAAGGPTEAATPAAGTGAEIRERRPGYDEDGERPPPTALNPWVAIGPDNRVTVRIDRSEMGQGVLTALATLVAEELEVDLAQVRTEFAPADPAYANPLLDAQITGGSTAVRAAWTSLRRAAAQAREQLRAAAAERWGVTSTACRAQAGAVVHVPSGRRLRYAQLAAAAAARRAPRRVTLKDPA
ncbi:MAG: molybdopterin-dependent oxidoreductase, partial [Gammaproteobacteria bacterium]|nr:molybdopterin-dependent oxidoreductase [Gammaproteobacteria bacterium]